MESKLVDGKIPAWTSCPFRPGCSIAAVGDCHHMGLAHASPFLCDKAQEFDAQAQQESVYIRIPKPESHSVQGFATIVLYYGSEEDAEKAWSIIDKHLNS